MVRQRLWRGSKSPHISSFLVARLAARLKPCPSQIWLLSSAERGKAQAARSFLAGAFGAVDQVGAAFGIGRRFGQSGCQSAVGAADFRPLLQDYGRAVVDGR